MPRPPEPATSRSAGQRATSARTQPASPRGPTGRTGGVGGPVPRGLGASAGPDKRRFDNCKRCPGQPGAASAAAPGLPAAPRPAPSTARGTDVHKQDHRDRAIPAAVIVVVFFVAILVAALIWLAASLGGHLHNGERLVVVTTALTSCRPAFRPERRCGRADGTKHGITWPVRAPCVLTGRPFPGARHGDRVRDIAEPGHALLRAARA